MKYVWMMILALAWIWWTVKAIKDFWNCCKNFKHPFQHLEEYSEWWFCWHIMVLLVCSFFLWLWDMGMIGGCE